MGAVPFGAWPTWKQVFHTLQEHLVRIDRRTFKGDAEGAPETYDMVLEQEDNEPSLLYSVTIESSLDRVSPDQIRSLAKAFEFRPNIFGDQYGD